MSILEKLMEDEFTGDKMMKMEYVLSNRSMEEIWKEYINEKKVNSELKKKKERLSTAWCMLDTCVELLNSKGIREDKESYIFLISKMEEYISVAKKHFEEE